MKTYTERFNDMVEEIRTQDFLEIVDFVINPPASQKLIEDIDKKIGTTLDESFLKFYGEMNGVKLHWRIKQNLSQKKLDEISAKYDDYLIEIPEDEENPFAQINLIPLEDCLVNRSWPQFELSGSKRKFEFAGETYSYKKFGKQLKPFDLFSTYYCMAFFIEKGVGNPKVLLLSDYYIEWDSSRITDFASYLEMLFITRGIKHSRKEIYSEYRGDRKPLLITGPDYWKKKHIPKLFRKKN